MSDVLAFCSPGALLLTGLTNVQIVRTAQMLDIPAVVFVRGKIPLEETVTLAKSSGIPILLAKQSLYESLWKTLRRRIKTLLHTTAGSLTRGRPCLFRIQN